MGRNDRYNRELFVKISKKSNYLDEKVVEQVYMGILKVVAQELKGGDPVYLPHFGKFYLSKGVDCYRKTPVWVVKYKPSLKFKKYLQNKRSEKINEEG